MVAVAAVRIPEETISPCNSFSCCASGALNIIQIVRANNKIVTMLNRVPINLSIKTELVPDDFIY